MESYRVIASERVVLEGKTVAATIVYSLTSGKIIEIHDSLLEARRFPKGTYYDCSPHILLPGLVDAHVHFNEPTRTKWEGFETGTKAAAFGGVTTVIDMPLNSIPPTTTVANLEEKTAAATGQCHVDVGFYGGIIPGNEADLKGLVKAGVRGFKGFLIGSGVEEFPAVSSKDIEKAFAELADEKVTCMFHAEMIPPVSASVGDDVQASKPPLAPSGALSHYQTFLDSRPPAFETYAIQEIISLAHLAPKLPLHIVHLSTIEAIPILRHARANGVNITTETCFHYLSLAAEQIGQGDTRHKCCPPIREQSNQDGLWKELLRSDSVIQTVVSDHSPCTPDLKLLPKEIPGSIDGGGDGDFFTAWGGISSVGLGLSILWTERMHRGKNIGIEHIVQWCCINTAKQVGLEGVKGELRIGCDADFVVFDDGAKFTVEPSTMHFKNKCSAYQGREMIGMVSETYLRGHKVFSKSEGFREQSIGKLLLEPRHG